MSEYELPAAVSDEAAEPDEASATPLSDPAPTPRPDRTPTAGADPAPTPPSNPTPTAVTDVAPAAPSNRAPTAGADPAPTPPSNPTPTADAGLAAEPVAKPLTTPVSAGPTAETTQPAGQPATAEAPSQAAGAATTGSGDAASGLTAPTTDLGTPELGRPEIGGTAGQPASDLLDPDAGVTTRPETRSDPFAPDDDDDEAPPIWASGAPATGKQRAAVPDRKESPAESRPALLRPRNLVLIGLGVVLLLVIGIFGPTAWQVWSERDVHIDTPARINSLELDDSQGAHDTVDYMQNAIKTSVTLERTTGAVYAESSGDSKSVVFVGGTGTLVTPSEALDKSFGLITDEAGGVDAVHELPAGPLGGTMKCGTTTTDGNAMAVCGWADHGSLGIAMFPNRQVAESAELLRTMRKAMQSRN